MIFKTSYILILLFLFSITVHTQVINAGVSGNTTIDLLKRLQDDVLHQNPDMVIIMVGTNDVLNSKKMLSYSDYKANLSNLIKKIKNTSSNIVLVAPPTVDSVYLFERHDRELFKELPNVKLAVVRTIMTSLADEFDINFIDVYQEFVDQKLPQHNKDMFIRNEKNSNRRDGVHLTAIGYELVAQTIFTALKHNKLLQENQKIICFGDSLTYGAGVTHDKSYPATLSNLIAKNHY